MSKQKDPGRGRPRSGDDVASRFVSVRMEEADHAALAKEAEARGVTVAELVRQAVRAFLAPGAAEKKLARAVVSIRRLLDSALAILDDVVPR
jgi:hypothetical protein